MGRLIDIDELQGCAIIEPMTHEEFSHVLSCKNRIKHDDIPTAYDVDAVVKQIEELAQCDTECREFYGCRDCAYKAIIDIVRRGGVSNE
jgi:hypothetical protein